MKQDGSIIDAIVLLRTREATDDAVRRAFVRGPSPRPSAGSTPATAASPTREIRQVVTLRELAARLQMDVSACRRYVLKQGYIPVRQRTASSSFQVALTFTAQQADDIYAMRHAEGYC